jgi:hypothetical protein
MQIPKQAPMPATAYQAKFVDSHEFANTDFQRRWLIDSVFLAGVPGVVGGPKKTLKTSLVIDMAISLATGEPFLDTFPVREPQRVAVVSGEGDQGTLEATAQEIAKSKGVQLEDCDVLWSFDPPRLSQPSDVARLQRYLKAEKVKVVFIDPLFLSLFGCENASGASNLFETGVLLRRVSHACLEVGATPIFVHSTTKHTVWPKLNAVAPLDLDDLAFSGITEFVRQWVLLAARKAYKPHTGEHQLVLEASGNAGHFGCWEVEVTQGKMDDNLGGRTWQVGVRPWQPKQPAQKGQANEGSPAPRGTRPEPLL